MSLDQIAPPEQAPVTGQDSLSTGLQGQFQRWCDGRKPQEEKFLVNYADAMRIPLDGDTKDTGLSRAQKSKLFVGSTRGKIRSARAKIKDSLFGSGKMPFDTTPSNERLKGYSDVVEEIINFQLKDMGYRGMMGGGVNSLCTYGTSTIFGPFEKQKVHTSADLVPDELGVKRLTERKYAYPCPYFEHAPTMDVYNDIEASDTQSGMGVFWSSWKRPDEVKSWARLDGYNAEAIDYACTQLGTSSSGEGSDRTTDERANLYRFSRDGRVRVLRYFGLVRRADLEAWAPEQAQGMEEAPGAYAPEADEDEMVEAVIIMAGGIVIKASGSPYKDGRRPAWRCVYEEVEHEFYGVGIAENNEPHQRVVNAAFRLYIEGKAFALLKLCSIDKSKFNAGEDFRLYPGKQFDMRNGLTPEERKTAIIWHDMMDVTDGWENVIDLSERFSDDDTGITKYSQGTDSQHLNNTATGISMIMNASSLPMKEVIQNIDEMWIEKQIESLIDWNFENLTAEAVGVLLGEKQAAKWAEILEFGKTSFMNWKATGSSTFMVKEILMQKLQGFMQLALGNPITAPLVDARELLEQVWDSGEIGKESPVYDEETLKQKQAGAGPQIPPEVQETLGKQEELIKKQEEALASRDADVQIKMAEIASRERLESQRMLIADRDSRVKAEQGLANVELTEAKTDLTQAQTVTELAAAQLAPSEHMLNVATAAKDAEQVEQQLMLDAAALEQQPPEVTDDTA